jgi:hypothetical protein
MQITRAKIQKEIEQLNDTQLKEITEFIEFIKFRSKFQKKVTDLDQFASLYQEFTQEDRELAEIGMADYAQQLQQEDQSCPSAVEKCG